MPESDPETNLDIEAPVGGGSTATTPKPIKLSTLGTTVTAFSSSSGEKRSSQKRVLYASNKQPIRGEGGETISPDEGEPITETTAFDLKCLCWGGADKQLKAVWLKQGIQLQKAEKLFGYGLRMPKNETKNFLVCLNAYFIKHLLFGDDDKKDNKRGGAGNRKYNRKQKEEKLTDEKIAKMLEPKAKVQVDFFIEGLLEVLFKASGGEAAVFCVPGPKVCFEPSQKYLNDTVTEKLRFFTCQSKDHMRPVIKSFHDELTKENGQGCLLMLYSLVMSHGIDKIKEEMQDKTGLPLVDLGLGECHQALLNLVIAGQATPYVHNSTTEMEDGEERTGICGRNDIGLLISSENPQSEQVGAYLKTPLVPIWLSKCEGQMGILFNPNKDLLKSKGAENKFNLYYYANYEYDKTQKPKQTILTIDSRAAQREAEVDFDKVEHKAPALETAIDTKWPGAGINWNDEEPYVW